jgi:hypothetical protein
MSSLDRRTFMFAAAATASVASMSTVASGAAHAAESLTLAQATPTPTVATPAGAERLVQAQAILTVAESKRLIGRAVAQMPIVKDALANGLVIVIKGTTNAYVAEELTGQKVDHAAFVTGRVEPPKAAKKLPAVPAVNHLILEKGKRLDIPLPEAANKLKVGDVVIKGANALDYKNKLAAVHIADPAGGTTGITLPYVVARKAHLIIPIGLEKLVAGDITEQSKKMREPIQSLNQGPFGGAGGFQSMFLLTGEIVTELEAIEILTGATAFQCSGGGISGAEGAVWLVFRGTREQVTNALKLAQSVQGEPPYAS